MDLAVLLIKKYGNKYIDDPHMLKLAEKNSISIKDYISGKEEVKAFKEGQFLMLHHSTLRKVKIIISFLQLAATDKLKTNSHKLRDMYGFSLQGIFEYSRDNPILSIIIWAITIVAGGLFGYLISK